MNSVGKLFTVSRQRVLSGLFTNLTAGWIGAAIIFPNFSTLATLEGKIILTLDVAAATICLFFAFWLEERSKNE